MPRGVLSILGRERLTWFLVLVGAIFAMGTARQRPAAQASASPRAPRAGAITRDEALYQQALANGLERDDPIIRRRMVQKMEFLFQDPALIRTPSDAELAAYLAHNADRYRAPGLTAFSHVFFSRARRGRAAEEDATRALAVLRSARRQPELSPDLGDPFMLAYDFPPESSGEIASQFGSAFAEAVVVQTSGSWQGPVDSAYGVHLVRVRSRLPGRLPALTEIRARVLLDWTNEQQRDASDREYARIRSHYQAVISEENP